MAQETSIPKKRRGPKPTGWGTPVVVRLQPDMLAALDALIAQQPDPKPSRPEAVRQVLAMALNVVNRDGRHQ